MNFNDDSLGYLRKQQNFMNRDNDGDPFDTEAERGGDQSQLSPDMVRYMRGGKDSRKSIMEYYNQGIVNKQSKLKAVTFYFLRSGDESLITMKKEAYKRHNPEPETIEEIEAEDRTLGNPERVDPFSTNMPRKTCGEYTAFQAPGILGQTFNHVEICYHDVRVVEEEDAFVDEVREVYADMVFTSTINNDGPALFRDKVNSSKIYKDAWQITMAEELFYESFTQMKTFVTENTNRFSYSFGWFLLMPWLDTCCFSKCINTDGIYSCSRLAADCLLSMKLGNSVFFHSLREHRAVTPDDIFAILARFNYVHKNHHNEVSMGSVRQQQESNESMLLTRDIQSGAELPIISLPNKQKGPSRSDPFTRGFSDPSDIDLTDEETIELNREMGLALSKEKRMKRDEFKAKKRYEKILEQRKDHSDDMAYIDESHPSNFTEQRRMNHFVNCIGPLRLNVTTYTISGEIYTFQLYRSKVEQAKEDLKNDKKKRLRNM